ncbi:hypothetical protein BJ875DRAFT_460491 [Amylocarpus encephaloides]|uniref:Uncharacterized protein n=1 Tax=Amylocarpus encephaloides TaxID=45428 RepID=A0A9P7YJ90_9HELO|nr:hypothetical protein BJ875DRAFT_460491 [Amylocarpus encephaloides]
MAMVEKDELEVLIGHIPSCCPGTTSHNLECCCGRKDCAYLNHNCAALEDLEKEVHTAATLGQALLLRHEQYMHDAERDRLEMTATIEQLESDKKELEDANTRSVDENRALLQQLEGLNTAVSDSETQINSLESTLLSTRQDLRRLEALAARTQDLEVQLAALEQEQDLLQKTVIRTESEERAAIQKWKKSERRICDLQDELERIECEARDEREQHVEVLGRIERQRMVEIELDTAARRLKVAAAPTSGTKSGSNVVSHFVKDILHDNANLQLGIVELREMLMSSNDEVQSLREQLMLLQSVDTDGHETPTLGAELATKAPKPSAISQTLHIHHHYHGSKREDPRRPKKKRVSLNTTNFTPPRGSQTPRSPRTPRIQDTASAILSQTSVSIPTPHAPNNRWSMQSGATSDFAPSSVPSSPQSIYRNGTLFDRGFDLDSSRPTSPGSSIDPMSPQFAPFRHRKRGSDVSARNIGLVPKIQPENVIQEEDDDVHGIPNLLTPTLPTLKIDTSITEATQHIDYEPPAHDTWHENFGPTLRRATSHESILSISGIDIHTLKSHPSQLTINSTNALYRPRPRSRHNTPSSMVSVNTAVTARPTLSRASNNSASYLRSSMQADRSDARSISSADSNEGSASNSGLGRKLGGWVFGTWGVSPSKTSRASSSSSQQRIVGASYAPPDPLRVAMGRPPGINQKGPIPGFVRKADRVPSKVTTDVVDRDALREILLEGGAGEL